MYSLLGYTQWRNFEAIINKAKAACTNAGEDVTYHFQTRRAELVEQRLLDYERVQARTELAETEKLLSGVFYERGVDSKGFAIIRSKGDKALFRLDTALLKCKLGAPHSRPLVDFLPTISIKAKDFAAEMTSINVQQKDLYGQSSIEKEHIENNTAVRNMMG